MLINPNKDWKWIFCHQKNRLTLEMNNDMLFVSAFEKRHLINDAFSTSHMSVEHTEDFSYFLEKLSFNLPVPMDYIYQITLNCLVAKTFYKPLMPKSWFFSTSDILSTISVANVVKLQSEFEQRHYVVVETDANTSTLLLIEKSHHLNKVKSLEQFEMIKVMNNRLIPAELETKQQTHAA